MQPRGERLTFDQFHHEELRPVRLVELVDSGNVWMIQCGEKMGFALEACNTFRIYRCQDHSHR